MALDVVLIHLGGRRPRHMRDAVAQATAVTGRKPIVIGPLEGRRVRSELLTRFRRGERLTEFGLGGFWRYSAERLFVLEEAMRRAGIERCLHIESDNLLYVDPGSYEAWLHDAYGADVATCPLTADEDTAAVLYVGSLGALTEFNRGLVELVEMEPARLLEAHGGPMANEMRMLHLLRTDRDLARALPVTVGAAVAAGAPVVFDPASYGQQVDGTPGAPGRPYAGEHHVIGRDLLAGRSRIFWDAQQRHPMVESTTDGAVLPLANLHIHSKRLGRWTTEVSPPSIAPPGRARAARDAVAGAARTHAWRVRRSLR